MSYVKTEWQTGDLITADKINKIEDGIEVLSEGYEEIKSDLANSKKAIAELNEKKITKFYANNLGETNLPDSDNGKIMNMLIYGKSEQFQGEIELEDGTTVTVPCPDYPQEIQSVVNPVVKVCGKNLLNPTLVTETSYGITCTANGDGTYTLNGTATENVRFVLGGNVKLKKGVSYKFLGAPDGCSNSTYYLYNGIDGKYYDVVDKNGVIVIPNKDFEISLNAYVYKGYTVNDLLFKPMITTDLNATYDDYEPYTETTATLPYTLNAIPVSSGGNVTIDGQQYIADYVDIEKKKLVRNVGDVDLGSFNYLYHNNDGQYCFFTLDIKNAKGSSDYGTSIANGLCNIYRKENWINNRTGSDYDNTFAIAPVGSISIRNSSYTDVTAFKEAMSGAKLLYELATPTIIDLTDEEVQAFKELHTYYPATNIINSSDQLDGFTTFNYPVSLINGWEYVKQQIGDTREYIYDMELQSAEAYVNSEYAVTLTELGV